MPQRYVLILAIMVALMLAGCYKKPDALSPPTGGDRAISDVRNYFPHEPGQIWVYEGVGNEYAAFVSGVMYRQEGKAQFYQDNGGTRLGLVYAIANDAVTLVFAQEEFYADTKLFDKPANRQRIVLKAPLNVGQTWETQQERREVVSITEKVEVPSGQYQDVVKINVISLVPNVQQQTVEYYAPGIGLVLREFTSGDTKIVSRLKSIKK